MGESFVPTTLETAEDDDDDDEDDRDTTLDTLANIHTAIDVDSRSGHE
jgi:hypothetical protein